MQQPVEWKTPLKGVNKNLAYTDKAKEYAVDALNVLPFDRNGMLRAAQRGGTEKLYASAIGGGTENVALLTQVTFALDPSTVVADTTLVTEPFTYANGNLQTQATNAVWRTYSSAAINNGSGLQTASTSNTVSVSSNAAADASGSTNASAAVYQPALTLGQAYIVSANVVLATSNSSRRVRLLARVNKSAPFTTGPGIIMLELTRSVMSIIEKDPTVGGSTTLATYTFPTALSNGTYTLELRVNGQSVQGWLGGNLIVTGTAAGLPTNDGVGFGFSTIASASEWNVDNWQVFTAEPAASFRQTNLVAVSGGSIYVGDLDSTELTLGGTDVLADGIIPSAAYSAGNVYIVDGFSIYKTDLRSRITTAFTATAGTAPTQCTLAAMWRDRLVLGAPRDNPQNVFFSRVGTHTDFDYSQTDNAAAFAGNASTAGRIGEPVTALIPFSDDVLLIGGDHNLWAVRGDPADGGSIDNLSDAVGVLGANAWTKSPDGTVYFAGTGGLYRMAPGGSTPENISSDKWNDFFSTINRGSHYVVLTFDVDNQGLYVFVTPANDATTTHLWYDLRTGGFWPIQFPVNHGPICALVYDGDGPDDRVLLLGGREGYIQKLDPAIIGSDDGTAISSSLTFAPWSPSDSLEAVLEWLDVTLGEPQAGVAAGDYNVAVNVKAGQAMEQAVNNPKLTRSKTFTSPRRQARWLNRTRGNAFVVTLSNSTLGKTWNLERITGMAMPGGLVRRR